LDTTVQNGIRAESIDLVDIPQHCGLSQISAKIGQPKAR
jgi:hypothetical protein